MRITSELEVQYRHTLEALGKRPGILGIIFRKAQNKIQDLRSALDEFEQLAQALAPTSNCASA